MEESKKLKEAMKRNEELLKTVDEMKENEEKNRKEIEDLKVIVNDNKNAIDRKLDEDETIIINRMDEIEKMMEERNNNAIKDLNKKVEN